MDINLKYAVIRYKKGTITTFELFFDGHSADCAKYDLLDRAANPVISFFFILARLYTPPLDLVYEYTALNTCHTI